MAWDPAVNYSFIFSNCMMFFAKCFGFVCFWTKYDLRPVELKMSQKKIINLSCELQLSTKSKAKSIAFASALKIEEPSGMRIVW